MKRNYGMLVMIMVLFSVILTSCGCKHEWEDATCFTPKTCKVCGESKGDKLTHTSQNGLCDNCGYVITEYGILGKDEALVFSKLKEACTAFKNPASIRLIDVIQIGKDNNSCVVTISAENGFGARSKEDYNISAEGKLLEVGWLGVNKDNKEYDIASINEALQTYYRSMGWI